MSQSANALWTIRSWEDHMDRVQYRCATRFADDAIPTSKRKEVVLPELNVRTRLTGEVSIVVEVFVNYAAEFLPRRADTVKARYRFDDEPVRSVDASRSGDGAAFFFPGPGLATMLTIYRSRVLHVEVNTNRGPAYSQFELTGGADAINDLLAAAKVADIDSIARVNLSIADHILRLGPRNTVLVKRALTSLRLYAGPATTAKDAGLFAAAQEFGMSNRVSEIFGAIEYRTGMLDSLLHGKQRINKPWAIELLDKMPANLRQECGPLNIFD